MSVFQHVRDVTVGSGRLFFAELDTNGNPKGYKYLGDSEGFSISASTEQVESWSGDGPVAERMISKTVAVEYTFDLVLNEVSEQNFGLFLLGSAGSRAQAAETGEEFEIEVVQGEYYQIGATAANPAGVKEITAVVVTDGASTTYVLGTDYELDAATGTIYIIKGGGIASGAPETIEVECNIPAKSYLKADTSDQGRPNVAIRYIEDTNEGIERDLFMINVDLRPEGSVEFKSRDTHQQIPLAGVALVGRDGSPAIRIERRTGA
jgi:hypothetical protein